MLLLIEGTFLSPVHAGVEVDKNLPSTLWRRRLAGVKLSTSTPVWTSHYRPLPNIPCVWYGM